jgi:hypothetical protein
MIVLSFVGLVVGNALIIGRVTNWSTSSLRWLRLSVMVMSACVLATEISRPFQTLHFAASRLGCVAICVITLTWFLLLLEKINPIQQSAKEHLPTLFSGGAPVLFGGLALIFITILLGMLIGNACYKCISPGEESWFRYLAGTSVLLQLGIFFIGASALLISTTVDRKLKGR